MEALVSLVIKRQSHIRTPLTMLHADASSCFAVVLDSCPWVTDPTYPVSARPDVCQPSGWTTNIWAWCPLAPPWSWTAKKNAVAMLVKPTRKSKWYMTYARELAHWRVGNCSLSLKHKAYPKETRCFSKHVWKEWKISELDLPEPHQIWEMRARRHSTKTGACIPTAATK